MPRKIYKLCVSYDEAGARLRQKVAQGVKGASDFVWQASFRDLESAELPPGDGVVWVYPVFMQTGRTVTETLPELLRSLYAERGLSPALEFRPVWGAERTWNLGVWKSLEKELEQGASLLVVAHGVTGRELPPEPSDFLEHSKVWLPKGTEMALAYFGVSPSVEEVLPSLKGKKVLVLPFLIGEGKHMREDMPSPELAARFGKEVKILPPFGTFYLQAEHASRPAEPEGGAEKNSDWPDMANLEDVRAWYLRQFEETREELEQIPEYGAMREGAAPVIEQIAKAFAGVELGNGIGLLQADYRDMEGFGEVFRGLAASDERHDWTKLTAAMLNHCFTALCFTDPEGYRFLVPAFMCCDLRRRMWSYMEVTCSEDFAEWGLEATALLSADQRRAMEAYVDFCRSCREEGGEDRKLPWQWN